MWGDYNPRPWDRFQFRHMLDHRYSLNWNVLLDSIVGGLIHAEWDNALSVLMAVTNVASLGLDFGSWPFFVYAGDRSWQPKQIQHLLHKKGVPTWGWGFHANSFFFRVPRRQSEWAQYLLLSSGVPLRGRLLKGSRAIPSGWSWNRCVGDCEEIDVKEERER